MIQIQCNFRSKVLKMNTSVTVLLPNYSGKGPLSEIYDQTTKFKTLYLLHGYTEDQTTWSRYSSIERYAENKHLAVVMPLAYNSYYTNMVHGTDYFTYLSEELPAAMRAMFPLSCKREDNFVAGLSMGGRGAFLWAFKKPEFFGAAACLSGSLNLDELYNRKCKETADGHFKLFDDIFGDASKLRSDDNDIYFLAKKLKKSGIEPPKLYIACGTEDVRYENQFKPFVAYAKEIGLELYHEEGPGDHNFDFWDPYIKRVIDWLPL